MTRPGVGGQFGSARATEDEAGLCDLGKKDLNGRMDCSGDTHETELGRTRI